MKGRQLSVAAAMAAVGYSAVGFAAMKSPTPLWVNTMFSLALALLAIAILGAAYRRAFWLGFAVVGAGYMMVALGPWIGERLGPRLVSTTLILRVYNSLEYRPKKKYEDVWWSTDSGFKNGYVNEIDTQQLSTAIEIHCSDGATYPVHVSRFRPIDPVSYRILGHSVVCPILAFLGGIIASRFARSESGLSGTRADNMSRRENEGDQPGN